MKSAPDPQGQYPNSASAVRFVVALYLSQLGGKVCPREYEERQRLLGVFVGEHGELPVRDCKPAHLALWVDAHSEWRSDWTRKRVIAVVHACFNWAAKMGLIPGNPFQGVTNPVGEPGQPMSDEHFRGLLKATDALFRRLLIFLRFTGCRPGEASNLDWEHLDFDRQVATLWRHKTVRSLRARKPRLIVLHPVALKLLRWLQRQGGSSGPIFLNRNGRRWERRALGLRMMRLRRRLDIPARVKMYGLRHGYGTEAIKAGVDIKTVAELMGHASTRTTEHYVHIAGATEHLTAAAQKMFRKP